MAVTKGIFTNRLHRAWEGKGSKSCIIESFLFDGLELAGLLKGYASQIMAVTKGIFTDRFRSRWNRQVPIDILYATPELSTCLAISSHRERLRRVAQRAATCAAISRCT